MNKKHGFPLTLTALAIATAFPAYAAQAGGGRHLMPRRPNP